MFSRFTQHFRQQFVGYIALFIAMGGVSYAAVQVPAHSVGPKQLKDGSVTPPKVAPPTIALFKGQRGLQGLTGLQGSAGPRGDTGAPGTNGTNGANGTNGTNGTNGATHLTVRTAGGSDAYQGTATCNPGEVATGGGVRPNNGGTSYVYMSMPYPNTPGGVPTGWYAYMSGGLGVTVYVVCASP